MHNSAHLTDVELIFDVVVAGSDLQHIRLVMLYGMAHFQGLTETTNISQRWRVFSLKLGHAKQRAICFPSRNAGTSFFLFKNSILVSLLAKYELFSQISQCYCAFKV